MLYQAIQKAQVFFHVHVVFKNVNLAVLKKKLVFCSTHSHTVTPFDAPGKQALEKTVGKEEITCSKQFLLFPQCILPFWLTF